MTGFEVKVSRADWKKELEQPEKAEEMARFCRQWFIACPDKLIDKDEVPPGWGLIYVKNGTARHVKPAPEKESIEPTWMLFASLMRDVVENWVPQSLVDQRIHAATEAKAKQMKDNQSYELKKALKDVAEMTARIHAFEAASGIKMDKYSEYFQGEIGKAVAAIRQWRRMPMDELAVMQAGIEKLGREFGEVISAIREAAQAREA